MKESMTILHPSLLLFSVVGCFLSSVWAYNEWEYNDNTVKKIISLGLAILFGIGLCVIVFCMFRERNIRRHHSSDDFVTDLPPLHHAVKTNNIARVREILRKHPELVNKPVAYHRLRGVTPLMLSGSGEMIKILTRHGADVNAVAKSPGSGTDGMTVFDYIFLNMLDKNNWVGELPDSDVIALRDLIENPAFDRTKIWLHRIDSLKVWELLLGYHDIPVTTQTFWNILEDYEWDDRWSAEKKSRFKRCLSLILDRPGMDVNRQDIWGDLPIMMAPPPIVEWLIDEKGAVVDPEVRNNDGKTVVDCWREFWTDAQFKHLYEKYIQNI